MKIDYLVSILLNEINGAENCCCMPTINDIAADCSPYNKHDQCHNAYHNIDRPLPECIFNAIMNKNGTTISNISYV